MRVPGPIGRALGDLRAFWRANLRVADEWRQDRSRLVRYVLLTWLVDGLALAFAAWVLEPVKFHGLDSVILTVVGISAANALIRPIVLRFLVRYAVLTLGLVSLLVNGLMIALVATVVPGFEVGDFGIAFGLSLYLAVVNMVLGLILDLDWADSWYRQVVLELYRRQPAGATAAAPGLLVVQVDGLAEPILRFAIRTGNAPTLASWVRGGSHRIARWDVLAPSQTSASQAGILHGSNDGIPAFRWYEKESGRLLVSNRPGDAAEIERRVSNGDGLLAGCGSSVSNLVSGDAGRSVLTTSTLRARDGVRSRDFFGFFADPSTVFRTFVLVGLEVVREAIEARQQRLRGVEPRIGRHWPYPLLRAAACVVLRDLSVGLVLEEMYRGVPVIYVDLVGYDEVAHHSGPERPESLDAIAEVDRQIGILARAATSTSRPYRVVVLSDHGQSQGATFRQRYGTTLEALIHELMAGDPAVLAATGSVEGWGYINTVLTQLAGGSGAGARLARGGLRTRGEAIAGRLDDGHETAQARDRATRAERADGAEAKPAGGKDVVVAASGNLANVYFTATPGRMTWEAIDAAHPGLVEALASHPGVGMVLVRSAAGSPVVLGASGSVEPGIHHLDTGEVHGADPLAPFGPLAEASLRRLDGMANVGDLVVISSYWADTGEVAAFEELVGSHGGLGGPQTEAFVLYPAGLAEPAAPIVGAPALHGVLRGWLEELGLRPGAHRTVEAASEPQAAPLT